MMPGGMPIKRIRTSEMMLSGTPAAIVRIHNPMREVVQEHEERDNDDDEENDDADRTECGHVSAPFRCSSGG